MDKILELIKAQDFDMNDLSKVLDVTKDTLAKMLDGKVQISTSQIKKIADHLNLDIDLNSLKGLTSLTDGKDVKDALGSITSLFK